MKQLLLSLTLLFFAGAVSNAHSVVQTWSADYQLNTGLKVSRRPSEIILGDNSGNRISGGKSIQFNNASLKLDQDEPTFRNEVSKLGFITKTSLESEAKSTTRSKKRKVILGNSSKENKKSRKVRSKKSKKERKSRMKSRKKANKRALKSDRKAQKRRAKQERKRNKMQAKRSKRQQSR